MAYEEYDYYNEPSTGSLKDSLYDILRGFQDKDKLRETGEGINRVRQALPGVAESVGRGAIAAVPGVVGDISEFGRTWAPEVMEKKFGKERFFPTTREILDYVPRMTPTHEGASTLEDVASLISPGIGGVTKDIAKLTKGVPIGLTIQDVSKTAPIVKEAEKLTSEIDELGFHSPLENAILKIQQPKGTGDQFLKQLERTPGVKTEELDVTGVKQYLLDHPTVTKQELLDQMQQSRVKLKNKVLDTGSGEGNTYEDYQLRGGDVYHDDDYIQVLADDLHYDMKNDDVIRSQEREALLEADPERYADYETNPYSQARLEEDIDGSLWEQAKSQANDMYYENPISHYYDEHGYDIYGNDEMGYTFKSPTGEFLNIGGRNGTYDLSDAEAALRDYHLEQGILSLNDEGAAKFEDYTLPGKYTNYREVLTTHNPAPAIVKDLGNGYWSAKEKPGQTGGLGKTKQEAIDRFNSLDEVRKFESSHYDEPNILAHTRLNDRIINGKKTLFVEEIQSDWHQAGRKKGYETPEVRENIAKERQRLLDQRDHFAELAEPYAAQGKDSPPDIVEGWTIASNGLQELQKIENGMRNSVPNAPFKKNWHELMMKQILNEAVKGNYDAVAFTTGKQQAARYNLSKQIDSLELLPSLSSDDIKPLRLKAYKDGKPVISRDIDESELPDLIGKEAAKKLLEQPMGKMRDRTLSGVEMDVGGEGMKGFYDKILPDYINKYGKKYGIKVKQTTLNTSNHNLDNKIIYEDGKYLVDAGDGLNYNTFDTKADAIRSLGGNDPEIHYFDVTDMAKKDIKEKGQPLFSGIGLAAPALMPEDQDKTKK